MLRAKIQHDKGTYRSFENAAWSSWPVPGAATLRWVARRTPDGGAFSNYLARWCDRRRVHRLPPWFATFSIREPASDPEEVWSSPPILRWIWSHSTSDTAPPRSPRGAWSTWNRLDDHPPLAFPGRVVRSGTKRKGKAVPFITENPSINPSIDQSSSWSINQVLQAHKSTAKNALERDAEPANCEDARCAIDRDFSEWFHPRCREHRRGYGQILLPRPSRRCKCWASSRRHGWWWWRRATGAAWFGGSEDCTASAPYRWPLRFHRGYLVLPWKWKWKKAWEQNPNNKFKIDQSINQSIHQTRVMLWPTFSFSFLYSIAVAYKKNIAQNTIFFFMCQSKPNLKNVKTERKPTDFFSGRWNSDVSLQHVHNLRGFTARCSAHV